VALVDFINDGYLSEALINFLALLSWHPKDDREIFSLNDLIKEFDMGRVQKAGPVFDYMKLDWLNHKYISEILPAEEIAKRGQSFVSADWKLTPSIVNAVKARLEKLSGLESAVRLFFVAPDYPADLLYWKNEKGNIKENLEKLFSIISEIDGFLKENLESEIFAIVPGDKKGEWLWPLRVALSGLKESPGPFEIMEGLGKEESLKRIRSAIEKL
jgi:glutamyl-tRNA synthetase